MRTLKFLFGYVKNYKLALAATVFSMFALTAVQLYEPQIIKQMIAIIEDPENLAASLDVVGSLSAATWRTLLAGALWPTRGRTSIAICSACHCASMRTARPGI